MSKLRTKRHGFGRRAATDVRDHLYRAPLKRPTPGVTSRTWYAGPALDQGYTSQCVAYSATGYLLAGPVRNLRQPFPTIEALYKECQRNDEWDGEDYDGTSVRAVFKVLQREGYIDRYVWAYDARTVANWILTTSPVNVGTSWLDSMMDMDKAGFVRVFANDNPQVVDGHAYTLIGANTLKKCPDGTVGALRILNSWGGSWGQNGRAWISFVDFDILMREDGEACTAVEIKRP